MSNDLANLNLYYGDGNLCLYNNDVKDVLKVLDNGSIDLVLTDPPYGINYVSRHRKDKLNKIENDNVLFMDLDLYWDKIRNTGSLWSFYSHKVELCDNVDYQDMYKLLLSQIETLRQELYCSGSKVDYLQSIANVIDEHGSYNPDKHISRIKNRIIWVKDNWTAGDLTGDFGNKYECIAFCPKGEFKLRGFRYPNVWEFGKVKVNNHPTEKPVALLKRIIESCTDVGDLVFDPFVGSGATMFACKMLNRRFVGVEIESGYCQNIVNDARLSQGGLGI